MMEAFLTTDIDYCSCHLMTVLIASGIFMHSASLLFVCKLVRELPDGINRLWWNLLGIMVLFFICGYAGFAWMKYGSEYTSPEALVSIVFFLGAVFVLLVSYLSYRTTLDLKRVYILEQETITDPLLGIFNRRYLDRRLTEEISRAKRHELRLAIMVVDIDYFKKINDTYGHKTGDIVLQNLAKILHDSLRHSDSLARFGGEEFIILLPHTTEDLAYNLAERLREKVASSVALPEDKVLSRPEIKITVSIGIACLPLDADENYDLVGQADAALYRAKQNGRNRVERCLLKQAKEAAMNGALQDSTC